MIPTVDQVVSDVEKLTADRPEVCRTRRIGTSRLGEPLRMLSVGHGRRNALVVGCPHPNEPIGLHTVLDLAKRVAATPELREGMDFSWHFVPCIDPDGTRLNEGWFDGPLTIRNYHENFYRPAFDDQPEWTFPVLDERAFFDRTLPETQALARVIDELRPTFQYSLHNADFGGVFFILNGGLPGMAEDLGTVAAEQRVPLSLGPVDTLGWETAAPAVYLMPPAETVIQEAARGTRDSVRHGGSSAHYAERYGTTTLITEVPMWHDARADDLSDSGRSYADTLRHAAAELRDDSAVLSDLYEQMRPRLVVPTPMRRSITDTLATASSAAAANDAMAERTPARPATVAEAFATSTLVHMLRLRASGMMRRQLAVEHAAGNQPPTSRKVKRHLDGLFDTWCAAAETDLSQDAFPVRQLVSVQSEAALAVVRRLAPCG
ncbi:M14 family zinc carboxypeptidase [Kutzneria kofuensis]|uniref:Peptidase M14 domain-containing protein n=1 Tax=Kutzneria kofuensis TaxID=103725 RepID=A0A7W9NJN9_9PSEU|nr:M14 family zinc carboxypeptidase [Kutzneria kofuensis]MBB5895130.1 hypothetical protein [Kutzneria kofuensis]